MVILDAQGAIVGRLGARVARLLLAGQTVEIINADRAVMAGTLASAAEKYASRRNQQNKRNPDESPKWPRTPQMLLRRMIRGMLPFRSQRGRDAYKRLRVVRGIPEKMASKPQKIVEASNEGKHRTFTLLELCQQLGGRV